MSEPWLILIQRCPNRRQSVVFCDPQPHFKITQLFWQLDVPLTMIYTFVVCKDAYKKDNGHPCFSGTPRHQLLSVKLFSNVAVGIMPNINCVVSVLNQQDCARISEMKSDLNW
jgi:hypothetical protein